MENTDQKISEYGHFSHSDRWCNSDLFIKMGDNLKYLFSINGWVWKRKISSIFPEEESRISGF